jgi:hypothetical protein
MEQSFLDQNAVENKRTLDTIAQYRIVAKKHAQKWHEHIRLWRRLYDFDHYNTSPKPGEERFPDPTPTNVTDLAVGIIMANGLEFRALGFSPSHGEREDTSRIEKFLVGLLDIASEREGYDVQYESILQACRDGSSVLYTVWDPILDSSEKMLGQHPKTGEPIPVYKTPPLCIKVLDATEIEFIPGGKGGFDHIFRIVQMTPYEVKQQFGKLPPKFATWSPMALMDPGAKHELVDYWCRTEIETQEPVIGPDGMPVFNQILGQPEMNPVKRQVIQHALTYAGEVMWPLEIAPGYEDLPFEIGKFKPIKKLDPSGFHSIIRPLESTVEFLEKSVNRRMHQIKVYTGMPMVARVMSGRGVDIDPGLTKIVELTTDEALEFPKWPGNPPDVDAQINYLRARLQQSGFADVMFGSGTGQVAGYALSQMGDQNRIRLEQPVRHLERMWSEWGRKVLRLIAAFGQGSMIRAYGRMRGKDFVEQVFGQEVSEYLVRAYIKPKFPNDQVRNHAMATQAAPWLSPWTIMERYLDIEQPDDEVDKMVQWQATQHPAFQQYAVMAALQDAADEGDEIAQQVLTMMKNGQLTGQPGRPPEGRRPEQMMGGMGPTGLPTRQEAGGEAPGQSALDTIEAMAAASPGMISGQVK